MGMNKVTLNFAVEGQSLSLTRVLDLAQGPVSYIEAIFSLGDDWTEFDHIRAIWKAGGDAIAVSLTNGYCLVPHELLVNIGNVKVNLVGCSFENEELVERLTTEQKVAIMVRRPALLTGEEEATVTPTIFEAFVAEVEADAAQASEDAESARQSREGIEQYWEETKTNAENAARDATSASESAQSALADANRAEQAATQAGWMEFHINDDGHLLYEHVGQLSVTFEIEDGHLYLKEVEQ